MDDYPRHDPRNDTKARPKGTTQRNDTKERPKARQLALVEFRRHNVPKAEYPLDIYELKMISQNTDRGFSTTVTERPGFKGGDAFPKISVSTFKNIGELNTPSHMEGTVNGLWQGQHSRTEELNDRISSRHFPDRALQPSFDIRPVPTKYSHFPMIDRRTKSAIMIQHNALHDTTTNFNPATKNGPAVTYLANIDIETVLQNRHTSLQHGADQGVYVPSSNSDLYGFSAVGRQEDMDERSMIFVRQPLHTKVPEITKQIGNNLFHNNTRTQLRGL